MAVALDASPGDESGECVGGHAPLPAVTPHQEGRAVEGDCRVGAGKGVMACAVRTVLLDAQFQPVVHGKAGGGAQSQLFQPLGVVLGDGDTQCSGVGHEA